MRLMFYETIHEVLFESGDVGLRWLNFWKWWWNNSLTGRLDLRLSRLGSTTNEWPAENPVEERPFKIPFRCAWSINWWKMPMTFSLFLAEHSTNATSQSIHSQSTISLETSRWSLRSLLLATMTIGGASKDAGSPSSFSCSSSSRDSRLASFRGTWVSGATDDDRREDGAELFRELFFFTSITSSRRRQTSSKDSLSVIE